MPILQMRKLRLKEFVNLSTIREPMHTEAKILQALALLAKEGGRMTATM